MWALLNYVPTEPVDSYCTSIICTLRYVLFAYMYALLLSVRVQINAMAEGKPFECTAKTTVGDFRKDFNVHFEANVQSFIHCRFDAIPMEPKFAHCLFSMKPWYAVRGGAVLSLIALSVCQ
jgi:hypothetical protein